MTHSVQIEQIRAGDQLARSIYDAEGNLQLCFGFTLRESDIDFLNTSGFETVDIFSEPPPLDPEKLLREIVRNAMIRNVTLVEDATANELPETLGREGIISAVEASDVWRGAEPTKDALDSAKELLLHGVEEATPLLASLPKSTFGEEESKHLLDVAIDTLMLAITFDFPPRDLRSIVLAALLHDIGKFIFPDLRNRPLESLEGFNALVMREHPNLSAMLVRGIQPGPSDVQTAIQHHHEAFNGNGYPQGLNGIGSPPGVLRRSELGMMHRYAEILNLANDYAGFIDGTYNGTRRTPLEAATLLVQGSGTLYNPFVVPELCSLVQRFPEGAMVNILSTSSGRYVGSSGVISIAGGSDESNPVKQILLMRNAKGMVITTTEVDLSSERHVKLRLAEI
ncbi:MAG: HD domain-containing phosphohydrolase [bacterium]